MPSFSLTGNGVFMKKLLLVDGNSMLFRAYYATAYGQKMTSPQGMPTNAVFGFANMMQKALDLTNPDAVLVAFDAGKHTFRHDLYADYKGGRKPAPDDLVPQFQMVRDYLDGYHIRWVERPDIEADDLIGTMSRHSEGYDTVILTSDHDLLQLITSDTVVMLMKKGLTEMEIMDEAALKEQMGIVPKQIIDMKALMGDHSDNIPGIPGVGEKTALKLLSEYGSVEEVIAHGDEIKGALGKKVREGKESAQLSKILATIKTDVDLDFEIEDCRFEPDYQSLVRFFESLNMRSLIRKYETQLNETPAAEEPEPEKVIGQVVHQLPADMMKDSLCVWLDSRDESFLTAEAAGMGFCLNGNAVYMNIDDIRSDHELLSWLKGKHVLIGYDVKRTLHILNRAGIEVCFSDDAMISGFLSDSTLTSTDKIMTAFGCTTSESYENIYGTAARPKLTSEEDRAVYCTQMASNIERIFQQSQEQLEAYKMMSLYKDLEMPLLYVLKDMEDIGVRCELPVLNEIAEDLKTRISSISNEIYDLAGHLFNLNSPKQLAEVLYDELGLPSGKKRSTSADVLEQFAGMHPIITLILDYRKLQKIYSTYAEGLQKYIQKDGRIHTLYNQCVTQTGRLSSSEPNLQNISVRDEEGKVIRRAFMPDEGCVLISSDYHQIELRMLADMADETSLIEAFNEGIDIHTKTAMDVFGVSLDDVTPEMRRRAKTVNFGIVYGISDFGLSQQLNISRREAAEFIEQYYKSYPKIRTYMNSIVEFCEKNGYVETLMGRRREIPEIKDKNRQVREFGRRAAMNAPIQGSAADLIKLAMINIYRRMQEAGVRSRMILQVHDELIFNVPEDEIEQMTKLIEEGMTQAMKLKVPLTVECSVGKNWYEAK